MTESLRTLRLCGEKKIGYLTAEALRTRRKKIVMNGLTEKATRNIYRRGAEDAGHRHFEFRNSHFEVVLCLCGENEFGCLTAEALRAPRKSN